MTNSSTLRRILGSLNIIKFLYEEILHFQDTEICNQKYLTACAGAIAAFFYDFPDISVSWLSDHRETNEVIYLFTSIDNQCSLLE
jgi:hypothetical protein